MVYEPVDTNGDGVADMWGVDYNGDGMYEERAFDLNGNGVLDVYGYDYNQNGYFETLVYDTTGDDVPDMMVLDANENGVEDRMEYATTHTAPGSAGPVMAQPTWASGDSGVVRGPGAEIVMDSRSFDARTTIAPDGYEYVRREG